MAIIKNNVIKLTEEEREAIEIVRKLTNDIYYGLSDTEMHRFNKIMETSWGYNVEDARSIVVSILDLSCLLDDFQGNIDKFNN